MKFYKSADGEVFAYESDGSQDEWIGADLVPMTDSEVDLHLNPTQSLEETKVLIAARRYQAEIAGLTVNGMQIDTGRDSQALITGAALSAMLDSSYVCNWKTPDGPVELDAQNLIAIVQKVRAHVQRCFDREFELIAAFKGGTYSDQMLDEGWTA